MQLNEWFEKGLTKDEYMSRLDRHREGFMHIYEKFTLPDNDKFFQSLKNKQLRVVALAEVWCGHCMLNIPILLQLAEKTNMDVRFLPRDENLELMDQYLTNGNRTIPIFIFIDQEGNEVAKWGPIAKKTRQYVNELRATLPEKDSADYDEKFAEMIRQVTEQLETNSEFWNASYESMEEALQKIV